MVLKHKVKFLLNDNVCKNYSCAAQRRKRRFKDAYSIKELTKINSVLLKKVGNVAVNHISGDLILNHLKVA